jgi:hypothetical protein
MDAVLDFIWELDGDQREVATFLHELISSFPETQPRIRYKIPFYYRKSWICYLNPVKNQGIELAFTRGNELSNTQGILASKGRKQVYGITYFKIDDIEEESLLEIIQEALILDEGVPYGSKRRSKFKDKG